jgi:UDP-N-acetylglucosamine 2-epimerase (non-hydrolysing)
MKILSVVGARPNFMKIAPLIKAINKDALHPVEHILVHTGQHYDQGMSDVFFHELGIPAPDINLQIGSGSHAEQTARVMLAFEPVCIEHRPDWVVVVGDVNSTMACSLVASKLGIKVAHVEAGLRSFDRTMPEEINRIVTDALADLLLTPSADANENLKREGVPERRIRLVGNIMIDALVANLERARQSKLMAELGLTRMGFAYVTLHRPSNVDDRAHLTQIMDALDRLAGKLPVVFPIHPRTRGMLEEFNIPVRHETNLKLLGPIGYHDSLCLTESARFVLTDSGGIQEESTFLRTPCLTLRPNTERPITVEIGTNKLTRLDRLWTDIEEILQDRRSPGQIPMYWDGRTAERVLVALLETA